MAQLSQVFLIAE